MSSTPNVNRQYFSEPPQHRAEGATSAGANVAKAAVAGAGFAAQLASTAAAGTPYGALPGAAANLANAIAGKSGTGAAGFESNLADNQQQFMELLNLQNQMQVQNQVFSTMSNVSKTEHETRMAAVRNIRA